VKNCFVCMPLIDDLRAIYYDAILPEVKDAFGSQCQCSKADDQRQAWLPRRSSILSSTRISSSP
jgi:hypothetical protein